MKKILAALLLLLPLAAGAGGPPYKTGDPATDEDFREIFQEMANHTHNNDGSRRLDPFVIPPRAQIDNIITPVTVGEAFFDSVGLVVCVSTKAADAGAWTVIYSSSTPCPH